MTSSPREQPARSTLKRFAPRIVVSLLLAFGFAWALKRGGLPFAPPAGTAQALTWWAVPAFVVTMATSFYFRTLRWYHQLRPLAPDISKRVTFAVGLLGSGAVFFAPMRLGEMVRPYLLSTHEPEVSFAHGLGSIAAERAIDGISIVLLTSTALALSTPISPLPDHVGKLPIPVSMVPGALLTATVVFVVAFAGLILLYAMRSRAGAQLRSVSSRVSPALGERLAKMLENGANGIAFLSSWRSASPFLTNTFSYWGLSAAANWLLMRGVGLPATFGHAAVALGFMGLGTLLPAGPGFFGAYQVATYTALAMYYPMHEVTTYGALFVFVSYVAHVGLNALSCVLGLALLSGRLGANGHGLGPSS
jgi:uncharacterized protein (TIRG00374 family)